MITAQMRKELKEKAEAATNGKWRSHKTHPLYDGPYVDTETSKFVCETATDGDLGIKDAAYIAAAHPAVVLELLEMVQGYEDALKYYAQFSVTHKVEGGVFDPRFRMTPMKPLMEVTGNPAKEALAKYSGQGD